MFKIKFIDFRFNLKIYMTIKNLRNIIITILNAIKVNKSYIILPYNESIYTIINLLKLHCIKKIHFISNYILIEFNYYNLKSKINIKFLNIKDKKNYYTFNDLKKIAYIKGIILTSKGFCSILNAINLKKGGILFCTFN